MSDIKQEFPLRPGVIYLNHAGVSPWPRCCGEAIRRFSDENTHQGAYDYPGWMRTEQALRQRLADLISAPVAQDIALLKSTSEGLSVVAHGLDWRSGDNIVTSNQEFPSNRIVWESLQPRGVTLREVDLLDGASPEAALMAACDEHTRLLAISSVQYASGLRMDLAQLGDFCRQRGILFSVDAIQSLGVLEIDVQAQNIDFLAADGHKWLMAPEGLAVFYCRAELRERLALHQYGWHMVEDYLNFDRHDWQPATDARRFECGSPNMLAVHGLHASLGLLATLGVTEVGDAVLARTGHLIDLLDASPELELLSSRESGRRAGIVVFRAAGIDPDRLYRQLMEQGVVCALRGGGVRFSAHFYTPMEQLDEAVRLAEAIVDPG